MSTTWNDSYTVGWLAASIANYLRSGNRKLLRENYSAFLRSTDPDLRSALPKIPKEGRR